MLFFDFGWIFGLFLIFGGWPKCSFFPVPVPPVPVRCPVPPVPVPNLTVLRFPVRFASFLPSGQKIEKSVAQESSHKDNMAV